MGLSHVYHWHNGQRRLGSTYATRQYVNGLPLRPCMGLCRTLRVFMYVVVETHFRDNTVRFKFRSNDERWTSDSISPTPTFPSSLPLGPPTLPHRLRTALLRRPHQYEPSTRRAPSTMQTVSCSDHRSTECWKNHHPSENDQWWARGRARNSWWRWKVSGKGFPYLALTQTDQYSLSLRWTHHFLGEGWRSVESIDIIYFPFPPH